MKDEYGNYVPDQSATWPAVAFTAMWSTRGHGDPDVSVPLVYGGYTDIDTGNFWVNQDGTTTGWVLVSGGGGGGGGSVFITLPGGDPNGVYTAARPSIAYDDIGNIWLKTGSGNNDTGWEKRFSSEGEILPPAKSETGQRRPYSLVIPPMPVPQLVAEASNQKMLSRPSFWKRIGMFLGMCVWMLILFLPTLCRGALAPPGLSTPWTTNKFAVGGIGVNNFFTNPVVIGASGDGSGFTNISSGQVGAQPTNSNLVQWGGITTNGQVPITIAGNSASATTAGTVSSIAGNTITAAQIVSGTIIASISGPLSNHADVVITGTSPGVGDLLAWSGIVWTNEPKTIFVSGAETITIAGTANQIASSAGSQDLTAPRTWTLSTPSDFRAPGTITATTSITNNGLNASQFVTTDANKAETSTLNGSTLTNLTGTNIVTTFPLWSGPTNLLTIANGVTYYKANASVAITNFIVAGYSQQLIVMNTNAATTIYGQVSSTANCGTWGTLASTANTNNITIAAGKSAIFWFSCISGIQTNYSNTVMQ